MKKNTFIALLGITLMLLPAVTFAVNKFPGVPRVWTYPLIYQADEQVTFYFDVTDIGFQEGVDLYMWAWQPTEPDAGNRNNSSDFAKLTYEGNNIYSKTMIPTEYFNAPLDAFGVNFAGFWMQLKVKTDDDCTTEFAAPDSRIQFQEFRDSGSKLTFYPNAFTLKEPLSILLNTEALGWTDATSINLHSGLNDRAPGLEQMFHAWLPDVVAKTAFKNLGNNIWKLDMVPFDYYNSIINDQDVLQPPAIGDDFVLENLAYTIVKGSWEATFEDGSPHKAGNAPVYPDPLFSYFPQKICALDILTINREWNESSAGTLKYTITAGTKTITGEMSGNRDKREASINLLGELAGLTGVTQIHVNIVTSNDIQVVNVDIPLVPLSEVE